MLLQDLKEIQTGKRELRKFGLLVGGVFIFLGLLMWLRHKPHFPWSLTPGCILFVLGAIAPVTLKLVYIAWMSVAIVLGFIVSNVLLTLFFFLVMTPVGLVARFAGKDFLSLKLSSTTSTYWLPRKREASKTPAAYEQQF